MQRDPIPRPLSRSYVSQQPGWKLLLLSLFVSIAMSWGLKAYVSPARLKGWIEEELARYPSKLRLTFKSARLSLSSGSIPQLAIRLADVEGRSTQSCSTQAGFRISEISVPIRVLSLVRGRIAISNVHGAHLVVDLDALRDRCDSMASDTSGEGDRFIAEARDEPPSRTAPPISAHQTASGGGESIRPWWTPEQLHSIRSLIGGLEFDLVELKFEGGRKSILLADVSGSPDAGQDAMSVVAEARLSPDLVYGQKLPPISLKALVQPRIAEVDAHGFLSEGAVRGRATLAAGQGDVRVVASVEATSVPLASLFAIAQRAGWLQTSMKPRFIWLNCRAEISGGLRRLFKENPLAISDCRLEGDSGRLRVDRAVIGPERTFEPFDVKIDFLDVRKVFEFMAFEGPTGIMSDFGRVNGVVHLESADTFAFAGDITGTSFRFSKQKTREEQRVPRISAKVGVRRGRIGFEISGAEIEGGRFEGRIDAQVDRTTGRGEFVVDILQIQFRPELQLLMTGGEAKRLSVSGQGGIDGAKIIRFNGEAELQDFENQDLRVARARLKAFFESGRTRFDLKASEGALRSESQLLERLSPIFFEHKSEPGWMTWKDLSGHFALEGRDFSWEKSSITLLSGGPIQLTSAGKLTDNGSLVGWISVDYPKLRQLRWDVGGTFRSPVLNPSERTAAEINKSPLNDARLGLLSKLTEKAPETPAVSARTESLRALGRRVLEKAKAILPEMSSPDEDPLPNSDAANQIEPAATSRPPSSASESEPAQEGPAQSGQTKPGQKKPSSP